jgi:hypothetical protein
MLVVVFLTLIFITAVTPVLSEQRGAVLRRGGHVLSRCFRYYVPDLSGKAMVQTPIIVRCVFDLFIVVSDDLFSGSDCLFSLFVASLSLIIDEMFSYCALSSGENRNLLRDFDLIGLLVIDEL